MDMEWFPRTIDHFFIQEIELTFQRRNTPTNIKTE